MSTRPNRLFVVLTAVLVMFVLSACQDDPVQPDLTTPTGSPDKLYANPAGYCDYELHNTLESIWEIPAGMYWRDYTGTIDCTRDDTLFVYPTDWDEGQFIRLFVPQGKLTPLVPGDDMVELTVSVPSRIDAYHAGETVEPWTSLPFYFQPDLQFNVDNGDSRDVQLTLCWPGWADRVGNSYELVNIETEVQEGDVHYRAEKIEESFAVSMDGTALPAGAELPTIWTDGIGFSIDHFSRWTLVNGDDPDGKGIVEEAGVVEEIHCWTDLPQDPLGPLPLIR